MLHDGVSTVDLIDHVVPAVARLLGQRWADDDLSFVEVTIGSARLQEEVRGLIAKEKANGPDHIGAPLCGKSAQRVLMVIPRAEEHTLGPFVAAHQFRRFGYDVDTAVDQSAKQIAIMLKQHRYCMVGLTTAGLKSLASTRDLVDIIRRTVAEGTPIVLGGSLITTEQNLKAETGVDYVVHSVRDALDLCGLSIVELDPPREIVQSY
jgi:methylmalonyl-CoA mutase cobalamin-binding subunit